MLTADELLAGGSLTYEINVPHETLDPSNGNGSMDAASRVKIKPLTVHDLQLVSRAAKDSDSLVAILMVQRALVEPELSVAQVSAMHVGLVQFLLGEINRISGIETTQEQMSDAAEAPLSKAAFVLSKEFGWTPQQVGEMTLGQVLLHLQMLRENAPA
jgi:hypothetical protein